MEGGRNIMAIKYLDSKRISFASTFRDDFTGGDLWVDNDSATGVSSNKLDFQMLSNGAPSTVSVHDLTSTDNEKWVLRFHSVNFSTLTASSNSFMSFCLSSGNQTLSNNGTQSAIIHRIGYMTGDKYLYAQDINNQAPNGVGADGSDAYTYLINTNYDIEIARTSATTYTVKSFIGGFDGTPVASTSGTCSSGLTGLRYIKIFGDNTHGSESGNFTGTIGKVEFFDGVITASYPTNVQDNSILVEKDTGNRYWFGENKVSTSELKAHYNFDSIGGGTTLTNQATTGDGLGSSANGVNTSITLDTTNEKLGTGAYSFNGSSSKVVLGSASDWTFLSDATSNTWSIAWWMIYDDTLESGHAIMSTSDGSTQTDGMFIDNSGSGTLRLIQVDGNNGSWSSAIPDNTSWHHYAITWNAGTVTLYVDGVSKGTQSQTAGSGTPQYGLTLGANNDEYYTELTLDEMGIWKRVLTTSEISALYNSGTGSIVTEAKSPTWTGNFDLTGLKTYYNFEQTSTTLTNMATSVGSTDSLGSSGDATASGTISTGVTGIVGNSWDFGGGKVTASHQFIPTSGDYTFSTWVNLDDISTAGEEILRHESPQFEVWRNTSGFNVMGASGIINIEAQSNLANGVWYNIVLVHSSSGDIIYLNGVSKSTADIISVPTGTAWYLGGRASSSEAINGKIDETTVWSRALSSSEVSGLYNSGRGKIVY